VAPPLFLHDGPADSKVTLVLAHGAGAPMDSDFMAYFARGVAAAGFRVARFEFPYMAARRHGRRPGPDREAVLHQSWRDAVAALGGPARLAIGGKSMGGRMASMVADEMGVRGLVCLGYPFHAPGRQDRPRTAHLLTMQTPALIVQGTRDPFGSPDDVAGYALPETVRVRWIEDGDHDLRPRASSGRTRAQNWAEGVEAVVAFLRERAQP
jgi:predicted alpha/beta-hydrolase family hydrolase